MIEIGPDYRKLKRFSTESIATRTIKNIKQRLRVV